MSLDKLFIYSFIFLEF